MAKETREDERDRERDDGRTDGEEDVLSDGEDPGRAAIPEIFRRAMSLGLTGFFTTEEAIRKALGDTLPKDWVDFASSQSERTRAEMLDRLALEFGRVLDTVDVVDVLGQLLEGHTVEVKAEINLRPRENDDQSRSGKTKLQVAGARKKAR